MSEQINYLPFLSEMEPPTGLAEWAARQGNLKKQYFIFKSGWRQAESGDKKERCVMAVCTACHGEMEFKSAESKVECWRAQPRIGFYLPEYEEYDHPTYSGENIICPMCRSMVQTMHISDIRGWFLLREWTVQVTRIPVEGRTDRLAIVEWATERRIDREGQSWYRTHLWDAYIVEERKLVRVAGYTTAMYGEQIETDLRQNVKFHNDFGAYRCIWPWSPKLLEGTTAENSKLDLYIKCGGKRLVNWLTLWRKKPQAENLLVQGYGKVVVGLLEDEASTGVPKLTEINWREKKPARMLGLTAEEFREYREKLSAKDYKAITWAKKNGVQIRYGLHDIQLLTSYNSRDMLLETVGDKDFWRGYEYLKKQHASVVTLSDYRKMAKKLMLDMSDGLVLWPRDLIKAHDRVTKVYNRMTKAEKDAVLDRAWSARVAELLKFSWSRDGILIRPCASLGELRKEGNTLHHCVFSYADRVLEGKTAIFFVRRADRPEEPWYTLELDEKTLTVRQNRGMRNCGKTPEVQAFEDAWVAWLKETFGQKNKTSKKPVAITAA